MESIRAVVLSPNVPGRLAIQSLDAPRPAANEALVRVAAISLNRGEVRRAMANDQVPRPGWDVAGTVLTAAADGSGPKAGARVVGLMRSGGWAEQIALPTNQVAELPEGISFAQAATIPVAGLTAMHALWKGGFLLERKVLVTGATGGVGDYALQLARLVGAKVVASVRRPEQIALAQESGADFVAVGEDLSDAKQYGPFALVIESVGGQVLADALSMLDENSVVVSFGTSAGNTVTFDAQKFYNTGLVSLYGMILFDELRTVEPAPLGLRRLADLIAQGKLKPRIAIEESWERIAEVAQQLMERTYPGKAVLHIGD